MTLEELLETLTYCADIEWVKRDSDWIGKFFIDSVEYGIILEIRTISLEKELTYVNAAFYVIDEDGVPSFILENNGTSPYKVLGTVANGTLDKLKTIEHSILIFGAADNIEKRMAFYNKNIVRKFNKIYGRWQENVQAKHGMFSMLINKKLSKEENDFVMSVLKDREHIEAKLK